MTNHLFGCTISLALALLVGGCGSAERRADQGCPDEEVLAASGACCDPALAVVVSGISDCAGSAVRPDTGTPDAGDASDDSDAGGFVFPCAPDEFLRADGDCVSITVTDGGTPDAGDGGSCTTTVITVSCPDGQVLREGRCADLVEACRFTCNAGQLLTDACDCTDPAPACKTCVGALLNTATGDCVVAPVCPGPCPSGTARDNAGTCVTVGNTWTFPCNAETGQVLKADGTCATPPSLPGPCPDGQARNNAGTCVPVSTPWTFPCNAGESLSANGTTCLPPPPPAWNQTCGSNQYLTPNGQQCVTPPAPWTFPCNAGLGEVLKADNTCYVPPVLPGPCPSGKARDNAGTCVSIASAWTFPCASGQLLAQDGTTCVTPVAPKMEVSFLPTPNAVLAPASGGPGQHNVPFGTVEFRNAANPLAAQVADLALTVLVADNPSGSYTAGSSGTVRAFDRITGCTLRDWPPLAGTYAGGTVLTDGRLFFSGLNLPVATSRKMDVACDFADQTPNGTDADAFALDVGTGTRAVSVDGSNRPALTVATGSTNGNPPLVSARLVCQYDIQAADGTTFQVKTRPSFSLATDSPSGSATRGMNEIARFTVRASPCGSVRLNKFLIDVSYTDRNGTNWGFNVYANANQKLMIAQDAVPDQWAGTPILRSVDASTLKFGVAFTGGLTIPAGTTKVIIVSVNSAIASSGDTVRGIPKEPVSWYGDNGPSGYPTDAKAPDLAAAVGNTLTFQ